MGVLTSSQLIDKAPSGIVQANRPANVKRYDGETKYAFKFPPAPLGESKVFLEVGGKSTEFKLKDGVYEIPKSKSLAEKNNMMKIFLDAGFEDICTTNKAHKPKIEKKFEYYAGHPDNTKTDKVEGKVAVEIDGEELQLECKKGIVTTQDKSVYQALLKKGFNEQKKPKELKGDK